MDDTTPVRQLLTATPEDVLGRLPLMDKVMIIAQSGGVTYERIGIVEQVSRSGGQVLCTGGGHDCAIAPEQLAAAVIDRSTKMKDKVLPKVEFLDRDSKTVFSVVGLGDAQSFEDALKMLAGETLEPVAATQRSGETPTLSQGDPGGAVLIAASKADADVAVEFQSRGLTQRWCGRVPEIRLSMGFFNIILGEFHLHVRGGAVARWAGAETDVNGEVELSAIDHDDKPIGFFVRGSRQALGLA